MSAVDNSKGKCNDEIASLRSLIGGKCLLLVRLDIRKQY